MNRPVCQMRHLVLISIDLPEVYRGQNRFAAFSLLPLEEVQKQTRGAVPVLPDVGVGTELL